MVIGELGQRFRRKIVELLRQKHCVGDAQAKGHDGPDIAEYRFGYSRLKLCDVLMTERK